MDILEERVYKAKAMRPNAGEHVSGHGAAPCRALVEEDILVL